MCASTATCFRRVLLAIAATALFPGIVGSAVAASTFGTSASTGVADNCNLAGVGGIQTGDATAIAPDARLVELCGNSLVDSNATASAGLGQGDVTISNGAFVLGRLHTSATASGPSRADGRAIAFEQITVVPTADFDGFAFDVVATYTIEGDIHGHAQAAAEMQTTSILESLDQSAAVCTFDCGLTPVPGGHHTFSIVETIPVLASSPFLSVQTTLDTFAGSSTFPLTEQPGDANFSDTGILSLTLPAGFTFVSAVNRGVLAPATSVAEPDVAYLLLAAAAAGGLAGRGRRRLPIAG